MAETNLTSATMTPEQIEVVLSEIADRSLAITTILDDALNDTAYNGPWAQMYAVKQLAATIGALADRSRADKFVGGFDEWMLPHSLHDPAEHAE